MYSNDRINKLITLLCKRSTILVAGLLAAGILLATGPVATAGPFDPSYRGAENSVHAIFEWVEPMSDWELVLFETGDSSFPLDPTTPETFDDGLNTTMIFPNFIDPLPLKLMRIQMLFDGAVDGTLIDMQVLGHDPEDVTEIETDRSSDSSPAQFIDWQLRPNPDWEEIFIFGDAEANIRPGNLLTIEIDTVSIPEPATVILAGVGLVALVAFGWRRKRRD